MDSHLAVRIMIRSPFAGTTSSASSGTVLLECVLGLPFSMAFGWTGSELLALGLGMAAKIAAHASGRLNRLRYDRLVVKWGWGRAKPCCLWIGRAMLPCLNLSVAM